MICIKCRQPIATGEFYLLAHCYQESEAMPMVSAIHAWCPPQVAEAQS